MRGENAAIPGGAVDLGLRKFNVKTSGSYESLDEIADTIVASRSGKVVRLRDVADVQWDTAEQLYIGRYNGQRAIFVAANAKDRVDVFDVRNGIYAKLDAFEQRLPPNVRLERGFDQTRNVGHRLTRLGIDFAIAITLVLLTLVPLGLRAASVVMVSIPLSLAIGLAALYFSGFSLNQLSIAGFVLALGLLVDDSIVVVENISRYLRAGYSRVEAAIAATDQIALAVLGCTATLLFAFLPLLFLPEGSGIFIRSLPAAVLYTVAASLFVALTVIPFLASRMLKVAPGDSEHAGNRALQGIMRFIHGVYAPALRAALAWPRRTLLAALGFVRALVRDRGHPRLQPVPERRHPPVPHRDRDADRRQPGGHGSRACASSRRSSPGARKSGTIFQQRRPWQSARLLQHLPRGDQGEHGGDLHRARPLRFARHAGAARGAARAVRRLPGRADHGRGLSQRPADQCADRSRGRRARPRTSCRSWPTGPRRSSPPPRARVTSTTQRAGCAPTST